MLNTLSYIGEKLNNGGVLWGVGASILLNHYGLIDKPNDIDLLINLNDIEKADSILKEIGEKKTSEKSAIYSTKYFYEYTINGYDVDVMADLSINHKDGTFSYIFDNRSIVHTLKINDKDIPLTCLEDWYVLYQLIPGRETKVKMIENFLFSNGIEEPYLLERALEGNLPKKVRDNIERMLNK